MISKNGIVSVYGFLLGLSISIIFFILQCGLLPVYKDNKDVNVVHLFIGYAVLTNILVRIAYRSIMYKVSISINSCTYLNLYAYETFCLTDMRTGFISRFDNGCWLVGLNSITSIMETIWMVINLK